MISKATNLTAISLTHPEKVTYFIICLFRNPNTDPTGDDLKLQKKDYLQ